MKGLVCIVIAALGGALMLSAVPAAADGPPQRFELPDEAFEGFNPCTGEMDTVALRGTVLVVHETQDATGGTHSTVRLSLRVTTAAGFEAQRENQIFSAQRDSGGSGIVVEQAVINVAAQGPSGEVLVGRVVGHLTVKDGEAKVEFASFDFSCRGKPA